MKKGVCKYCGNDFEYKGKTTSHCKEPDCLKKARSEAQRKWYSNKVKKQLGNATVNIIEREKKPVIVYSSKDREENKINFAEVGDVLQISREYGALRIQLIELLKKNSEEQSKFDKCKETFIHKLEFLDQMTDEEAITLIIDFKKALEVRRSVKDKRHVITAMLDAMPCNNLNAFVVQATQAKGDIVETIQRLKKDTNLYRRDAKG